MRLEYAVFIFCLFSFFGWLFELFLKALAGKGLVNRGFFYGPIIPIYGIVFFLAYSICKPFADSPVLVFFDNATMQLITILSFFVKSLSLILQHSMNIFAVDRIFYLYVKKVVVEFTPVQGGLITTPLAITQSIYLKKGADICVV